jgi:hypothetical protein
MKKFIGGVGAIILILLVLFVIFGLAFSIVGGLAIGLGYLLMRFFPWSLFEATVLGMVFAAIAIYLISHIASRLSQFGFGPRFMQDLEQDGNWAAEHMRIPTSRFYTTESERTWEAWLRAEIANDIYREFQEAGRAVVNLNQTQMQELAIRLSDLAIAILKRKRGGRGRLTINMANLRQELSRMGQQAYDDRIMRLALDAINLNLDYYDDELVNIIRTQRWDELADVPAE